MRKGTEMKGTKMKVCHWWNVGVPCIMFPGSISKVAKDRPGRAAVVMGIMQVG
jgi:hypothetical protein